MERFAYREAGPQLLMQAFLQQIVNGGGRVEREYTMGSETLSRNRGVYRKTGACVGDVKNKILVMPVDRTVFSRYSDPENSGSRFLLVVL